ncbi:hypothetical protein D3C81_07720 [compost metagenome]
MAKFKYITDTRRAIGINRLKSGEVYVDRAGKLYLYVTSGYYVPFVIKSSGFVSVDGRWILDGKAARKGHLLLYMGEDIRDLVETRQRLKSFSDYDKRLLEYVVIEASNLVSKVDTTIDDVKKAIPILQSVIRRGISESAKTILHKVFDSNMSDGRRNRANMVALTFAASMEEAEKLYYNLHFESERIIIKKGATLLLPESKGSDY